MTCNGSPRWRRLGRSLRSGRAIRPRRLRSIGDALNRRPPVRRCQRFAHRSAARPWGPRSCRPGGASPGAIAARPMQTLLARREQSILPRCVRTAMRSLRDGRRLSTWRSAIWLSARPRRAGWTAMAIPDAWAEAARSFELLPQPYTRAYARFREGEALLAAHRGAQRAGSALREAHQTAVTIGAAPLLGAVEAVGAARPRRAGDACRRGPRVRRPVCAHNARAGDPWPPGGWADESSDRRAALHHR